ncbi:MAG: 50S ribosomal protein L19 [Candidatus Humimicrobiaceae bacterium]|jgi:large subunit ribosomal protein L19|nr:50S ribosomal protein L19 [Actinomycetota bacterium]MDD5600682.1 50S ribosomal protein L19 [Actinomycetota bacterium]MDY0028245.1 50S ribosomal protein L19 [Candidatus Humimicrobiaceae bacterium]
MNKLDKIESKYIKTDIPEFKAGDKVRVKIRISEENKDRIQVFEGIVIRIKGTGINKTFTVRKISFNNIGVERTFLINSPVIQSIEKVGDGIVRRAKLYYLRDKVGKKSKVRFK